MEARRTEGRPFFVQWSSYALHAPGQALPETQAAYSNRMPGADTLQIQRAALAENLDTGVGRLLDHLHRLGLESNTFVLYMGDNGAGGGGRSATRLFNAGKGGLYEGGIRVPFILRGPGVATGAVCRVPVAGWDLLPTFSAQAGITQALPAPLDGTDLSPVLATGRGELIRTPDAFFFHFPHYQGDTPHSAVVQGDYKLIHWYEDDTRRLYDLSRDPGERRDLAGTMPEKAKALQDLLDRYLRDVGATMPKPNPDYDPSRAGANKAKGGPTGKSGRGDRAGHGRNAAPEHRMDGNT